MTNQKITSLYNLVGSLPVDSQKNIVVYAPHHDTGGDVLLGVTSGWLGRPAWKIDLQKCSLGSIQITKNNESRWITGEGYFIKYAFDDEEAICIKVSYYSED